MYSTRLLLAVVAWSLLCPLMEARAYVVLDARGPAEVPSQQQKGQPTGLSGSTSSSDVSRTSVVVATTTLIVSKTVSGNPTTAPEPLTLATSTPSLAGLLSSSGSSDGEDLLTASGAALTAASATANATIKNGYTSGMGNNHTLVITLSTVLSIVGFFITLGVVSVCWRHRHSRRRFPYFFRRGITPIDDDEIATWKVAHDEKKPRGPAPVMGPGGVAVGFGAARPLSGGAIREKETAASLRSVSSSYTRKPSSVIVYPGHPPAASRYSSEDNGRYATSPPRCYGSYSSYGGSTKRSFDQDSPLQCPIQARAPNARAGLTDEAVPGDDPFLPNPRRQPSRLAKFPPPAHVRTTRGGSGGGGGSSVRSFSGETAYCCYQTGGWGGSDLELSSSSTSSPGGRASHEYNHHHHRHSSGGGGHARMFSGSSIPPLRMSSDDYVVGGLSPRPAVREDEIGRAIG